MNVMTTFKQAHSIEEGLNFIEKNEIAFLYISRKDCGVCHAVRPQVQEILKTLPRIKSIEMDAGEVPEVAAEFQVLTVPALLLFADGKEIMREARFIQMAELERKFTQVAENY